MRHKMQKKDKRMLVWRLCCQGSFAQHGKKGKPLKTIVCEGRGSSYYGRA